MRVKYLAVFALFALFAGILLVSSTGANAATPADTKSRPPTFHTLQPGQQVTITQTIPVNIVLIGYPAGMVNTQNLLSQLPASSDPVVREPLFYGVQGRPLGLHYQYNYNVVRANSSAENSFFNYLRTHGESGPLTEFQQSYNDQEHNRLNVAPSVLYVDAPDVERWLENRSRSNFGIDVEHSYTVYFINWYSRADFRFHVYTKTDDPEPDTGYNVGLLSDRHKMIAWGGTSGRTWFYDLSAGPEFNSSSWNVDDSDLDFNGIADYRIPPIWEYATTGYRSPSLLTGDLAKLTRYVAIDILFTSSPIYDPLVTTPGLDGDKVVHIEMFEDDPASNGLNFIKKNYIRDKLRTFEPYYDWRLNIDDNNPIDPAAQRAFRIFAGLLSENDCWNEWGDTFAQLFCYFDSHLSQYVPAYDPDDYVAKFFAFNSTDGILFSGYADDNWVDGTQLYSYLFSTPTFRDVYKFGFTANTAHEIGHHMGLSHPHDGYDSSTGIDYYQSDDFYFVLAGDESHTFMSYLAVANGFGQFNQDDMYRWETAGYINKSNLLLDDILAHPNARQVYNLLNKAEDKATKALRDFNDWDYLKGVERAYDAYTNIATAATQLGIPVQTPKTLQMPTRMPPHEPERIRDPKIK